MWTFEKLKSLAETPLFRLLSKAHGIHEKFHVVGEIQICTLISIKTGGCIEDCKYCAQSASYKTAVQASPIMEYEQVLCEAKEAIQRGATRICLGAAWRAPKNGRPFERVLEMVRGITELGAEVCCTLGFLTEEQAEQLKSAGLYAYNHNLDTSEEFYPSIITTRSYQDRLKTLEIVGKSNLSLCCGGILGMGETESDRLNLLLTLSKQNPEPESVPINLLTAIPGTPLENLPKYSFWEFLRFIAITRIVLPKAMIRLSSGRIDLSFEQHSLAFLAGANSIFSGEKLLTVENHAEDKDEELFTLLGLEKRKSYA